MSNSSLQLSPQEVSQDIVDCARAIFNDWQAGDLAYQDALEKYAELRQSVHRPADEAQIELQLGIMQGYRGNYDASIDHFERARELAISVGNRGLIARSALNIGETYRLKGNFTRARQYFQASYEAAVAIGEKAIQVIARSNEAQMLISQGRYEQAEKILKEFYRISQEQWENPESGNIRKRRIHQLSEIAGALATVCMATARNEQAWTYAVEALKYAQEVDIAAQIGVSYRIIGQILTELGSSPDPAFVHDPDVYFNQSIETFREVKADGEIARTMHAHGKSLGKRGKRPEGVRKLQQATIIFTRLGMVDDAGRAAQDQLKML